MNRLDELHNIADETRKEIDMIQSKMTRIRILKEMNSDLKKTISLFKKSETILRGSDYPQKPFDILLNSVGEEEQIDIKNAIKLAIQRSIRVLEKELADIDNKFNQK